jgi:hypothetical protein
MGKLEDQTAAVRGVLEKEQKLTAADLQVLRENTRAVQHLSGRSDYAYVFRMEVELIDAIRALDETSAELIQQTNRLTSRIFVLTIVGVVVAVTGVGIAAIQLFR